MIRANISDYLAPATLVLAATATPLAIPTGIGIAGFYLVWYEFALVVTTVWALNRVRLTAAARLSIGLLAGWLALGAIVGAFGAYPVAKVVGDFRYPAELTAAAITAVAVLQSPRITDLCVEWLKWSLWFSATLTIAASVGLVVVTGRSETAALLSGEVGAQRFLTAATFYALATMCVTLGQAIVGVHSMRTSLLWWAPSLVILVLAFSRNHIVGVIVACALAIAACESLSAAGRGLRRVATGVAVAYLVIVSSPLVAGLPGGSWWDDQVSSYSTRVVGGLSSQARDNDPSAEYRVAEISYLQRAAEHSPVVGKGFGFAYQPPVPGKQGSFWEDRARYYSHNFYWWTIAKSGALGLAMVFAALVIPTFRGLRGPKQYRAFAATLGGMLAVSYFAPLPLDNPASLLVGILLGVVVAQLGIFDIVRQRRVGRFIGADFRAQPENLSPNRSRVSRSAFKMRLSPVKIHG